MGNGIDYLITKYLNGELSEEEEQKLNEWLHENDMHQEELEVVQDIWNTPVGYPRVLNIDDERDKLWQKLSKDKQPLIQHKDRRITIDLLKKGWKYAAVILILFLFHHFLPQLSPTPPPVVTKPHLIERNNPLGQKSKINLPDGSTVWLNADSKISYESNFNEKDRDIYLEGEAFFEVAKNAKKPFVVTTRNFTVTALGTSFNISAFDSNHTKKIALNTGIIKVQRKSSDKKTYEANILRPGEQALYDEHDGSVKISKYKNLDPFGWKDGRIVFQHATLNEVIEVLERWYNVEFEISGHRRQSWNYTGTFSNEVLENILESLKYSENMNYTINGSKVKIIL